MYGLAYCKLDYDYMMNLDINILSILLKAEMDKEIFEYDINMQTLAWQTALLMNSTGNYKKPVKPETLYTPLSEMNKKQKPIEVKKQDIDKKRKELLERFSIKQ